MGVGIKGACESLVEENREGTVGSILNEGIMFLTHQFYVCKVKLYVYISLPFLFEVSTG